MTDLGIQYDSKEWRLFIDSSTVCLEAVVLNIDNELPSVSLTHGVSAKETFENMTLLLEVVKFSENDPTPYKKEAL